MSQWEEDVLIVGAGQGGLSASFHLTQAGVPHRVVDRGGVGHSWERHRWDSFCLVTPNWTVNLPGRPYEGDDPDGFMHRDEFVAYLKDWAASFNAPVTSGVEVRRIERDGEGFHVATDQGGIRVRAVIVATATYQYPKLPAVSKSLPGDIRQLHAEDYKNPDQAANGAVMIVGSGQTGCQITEDFLRAGRETFLCVSRTGRLPRIYRGKDVLHWQKVMGLLDRTPDMLDDPSQRFVGDPHLTGRDGGGLVSLYRFAERGVHLLGRFIDVRGRTLKFKDDLHESLEWADRFCDDLVARTDGFIEDHGIDAPKGNEDLGHIAPDQLRPVSPLTLDLDQAGIGTVIWATGFAYDFSWIDGVPVDDLGYPKTEGAASPLDGLFFCGLNWMTKRKSGILYGVDEDARLVADQVQAFLKQSSAVCVSYRGKGITECTSA